MTAADMDIETQLAFGAVVGIALMALHKLVRLLLDRNATDRWTRVEAQLEDLSITMPPKRMSSDLRLVWARYSYSFGGVSYQGRSVSVLDLLPFPINQYRESVYQPLEEIFKTTKRIHVSVDPVRPSRAVLLEVPMGWYIAGGLFIVVSVPGLFYQLDVFTLPNTILATIGAIGVGLYVSVLVFSLKAGLRWPQASEN
ncbi:MAG TPA: DUF3592 domain-containing protein [Gammaproteobacteria bacterium]|nr:DUF3592 domain-containing protein [Gammaproteobacteria bacterium]